MINEVVFRSYINEYFYLLLDIFTNAYDDDAIMSTGSEYEYNISAENELNVIIDKSDISEVIVWKNKIIGGLFLKQNGQNIEILSIFIDPFYQNVELGTEIVKKNICQHNCDFEAKVPIYSKRLTYFFSKKCGFKISNTETYLIDNYFKYKKKVSQ